MIPCLFLIGQFSLFASNPELKSVQRFHAPQANQAAAADKDFFYAIGSRVITKHDRNTGGEVAKSSGKAKHLNSGYFHQGNLLCAHSNFPTLPEQSEVLSLDPKTMTLVNDNIIASASNLHRSLCFGIVYPSRSGIKSEGVA